MEKPFNLHHVFWEKQEFNSRNYSKNLRDNPATHFYLPLDYHKEIHHEVGKLERPSILIARLALDRILKRPDNYTDLDTMEDLANYIYYQEDGEDMAIHIDRQIPLIQLGQRALKHMTKY